MYKKQKVHFFFQNNVFVNIKINGEVSLIMLEFILNPQFVIVSSSFNSPLQIGTGSTVGFSVTRFESGVTCF